MDGLKEKTDLLARFNEISMAMAEPDADFDKLLAEQSEVQVSATTPTPTPTPARMPMQRGSQVHGASGMTRGPRPAACPPLRSASTSWIAGTWST